MSRRPGARGAGATTGGVHDSASAVSGTGAGLPGGKGVVEGIYELLWTKNNLLQVSYFTEVEFKPDTVSYCI